MAGSRESERSGIKENVAVRHAFNRARVEALLALVNILVLLQ